MVGWRSCSLGFGSRVTCLLLNRMMGMGRNEVMLCQPICLEGAERMLKHRRYGAMIRTELPTAGEWFLWHNIQMCESSLASLRVGECRKRKTAVLAGCVPRAAHSLPAQDLLQWMKAEHGAEQDAQTAGQLYKGWTRYIKNPHSFLTA